MPDLVYQGTRRLLLLKRKLKQAELAPGKLAAKKLATS